VNYEEFLVVFGLRNTGNILQRIFDELDKDKSGFLSKEEIMAAITGEKELKLRAAKISDLLIAWHKDKDQKIHYEEFVETWMKHKT
jgi:Ca2+-binding EF-hand superfamily protein